MTLGLLNHKNRIKANKTMLRRKKEKMSLTIQKLKMSML